MTAETAARLIVSIVALVNACAAIVGYSPLEISEGDVYQAVSLAFAVAAWAWGFWCNNDFTQEAREGTAYTRALKAAKHLKSES